MILGNRGMAVLQRGRVQSKDGTRGTVRLSFLLVSVRVPVHILIPVQAVECRSRVTMVLHLCTHMPMSEAVRLRAQEVVVRLPLVVAARGATMVAMAMVVVLALQAAVVLVVLVLPVVLALPVAVVLPAAVVLPVAVVLFAAVAVLLVLPVVVARLVLLALPVAVVLLVLLALPVVVVLQVLQALPDLQACLTCRCPLMVG